MNGRRVVATGLVGTASEPNDDREHPIGQAGSDEISTRGLATVTNGQFTATQVAAITGGTGRFRKSAGDVAIEDLSSTEPNITLSIRK